MILYSPSNAVCNTASKLQKWLSSNVIGKYSLKLF